MKPNDGHFRTNMLLLTEYCCTVNMIVLDILLLIILSPNNMSSSKYGCAGEVQSSASFCCGTSSHSLLKALKVMHIFLNIRQRYQYLCLVDI